MTERCDATREETSTVTLTLIDSDGSEREISEVENVEFTHPRRTSHKTTYDAKNHNVGVVTDVKTRDSTRDSIGFINEEDLETDDEWVSDYYTKDLSNTDADSTATSRNDGDDDDGGEGKYVCTVCETYRTDIETPRTRTKTYCKTCDDFTTFHRDLPGDDVLDGDAA